jgi:ComF family protein
MATGVGKSWPVLAMARRWQQRVARWGRTATRLLFPPRCAVCDADLLEAEDGLLLCDGCQDELAPPEWLGCPRCGAAFPPSSASHDCHRCRGARLHFDAVVPLGLYHGLLRDAVLKMKRASGEPLSMTIAHYLVRRRAAQITSLQPSVVMPVPMHWRRRWARHTNSPDLLAERLAKFLQVPLLDRALRRRRNTLPQKGLPPKDRFKNVRDAFRMAPGCDLRGARVLLVDDVLTTGATCSEAARLLKDRGGAEAVVVAVVARAEGDQ